MRSDFPASTGNGWYELSDGRKVRGREKAERLQGELTRQGRNRRQFDRMLVELERMGRLEEVDVARVAAVRSLAEAVDEEPHNARLWGQYRDALSDLMEGDEDVDSRLDEALQRLQGAAEVGDPAEAGP